MYPQGFCWAETWYLLKAEIKYFSPKSKLPSSSGTDANFFSQENCVHLQILINENIKHMKIMKRLGITYLSNFVLVKYWNYQLTTRPLNIFYALVNASLTQSLKCHISINLLGTDHSQSLNPTQNFFSPHTCANELPITK